ncbi:MAG: hypothetical protein HYX32_03445 [Actinobacteria bacterium]|nr:hypothetical protein [Actinomycetota bacterium]
MFDVRHRARIAPALVAVGAVVIAACTNEAAPEKSPAQAAQQMQTTMFLAPDTTSCLQTAFEANPDLASALNTASNESAPSQKRVDDFLAAVRPCLPPPALAEAYVKIIPTAVTIGGDQPACIRDSIAKLDQTKRDDLILLGAQVTGTETRFVAMSETASSITQACGLTGVAPTGSSPTVPEGGGATAISR